MFSAIVMNATPKRAQILRYLCTSADCLDILRDFDRVPGDHELKRFFASRQPNIAVIDVDAESAMDAATTIRQLAPDTAILGFGSPAQRVNIGFNEMIAVDASPEDFLAGVQTALRKNQGEVEAGLFSFLPAKAGSGCSTVVLNAAIALARDEHKRVLVVDSDLRSGILATMLGVTSKRSTEAVLEAAGSIGRDNFQSCIARVHGVDFLLSAHDFDAHPPTWAAYFHLLNLTRGMYDAILIDLPELINPATIELVRRSESIFMVCTAEIPSVTLAKHRCAELLRLKIPDDRIAILLNRWYRGEPSVSDISAAVGHPVTQVFPNDYRVVREAMMASGPVASRSKLGQAYSEFAASLGDNRSSKESSLSSRLKGLLRLSA